jgi:glycosyltransferase involved in cell wall biosynthesis
MKVALIFAGAEPDAALAPYRASPFLQALADEGLAPAVIGIAGERVAGSGPPREGIGRVCAASDLRALLAAERPDAIQTFGWATALAPVWESVGPTGIPLIHFVSAGGPVQDDSGLGAAGARVRPKFASFAGWRARFASRPVAGVIGSNRADIGQHFERGFFPRARFSVLAPPPVDMRDGASAGPAASTPTFGVYDPDATAHVLGFIAHAVSLTGHPDDLSFRIAPSRLRSLVHAPEVMSFVDAPDLESFVAAVDALVLPYCEDRMVPAVLAALKARKIVIVPDGGVASELIEYGRHGVVYAAGSAYHLSMAINIVAQSRKDRPLDFQGVDAVIARTSPREVARTFAATYGRLVS